MAVEIARQPQFQRMNAAYIGAVGKRKPVGRIAVIELAHRGGIGGLVGGEPVDQPGELRLRDAWKDGAIGGRQPGTQISGARSEEHTSELQSLMRLSYAVFCL